MACDGITPLPSQRLWPRLARSHNFPGQRIVCLKQTLRLRNNHIIVLTLVYFSGIVFSACSVSILFTAVEMATIHAAVKLHRSLLHNVLHSSLTFFDTTPVGRILSRFSGDIETVDDDFCGYFQIIFDTVLEVWLSKFSFNFNSVVEGVWISSSGNQRCNKKALGWYWPNWSCFCASGAWF